MINPEPTISLWLDGDQSVQLGQKGYYGATPVLRVHMHDTKNPATLVLSGYNSSTRTFNLVDALRSGILELREADSQTKVPVPQEDVPSGRLFVKAPPAMRLLDLNLDATDKFFTSIFSPDRTYELHWAHGDNQPWAFRGSDETEKAPIRLGKEPIKYRVIPATSTPIRFSVSIKPTEKVCHMSGDPKFGFKFSVTSHYSTPVTLNLHKTPLRELHGLEEIIHVEDASGQAVEWDYGIGCFEHDVPFPRDDDFEEFHLGVPYERTFWLTGLDGKDNGGDLSDLEAGKKYIGRVSRTVLRSLMAGQEGRKEELLVGSTEEKKERWGRRGKAIWLDVEGGFWFETV